MFFVISGFLISGLIFSELDKTQKFNIKRFFIRRAFKIYPSFYILIILTTLIFYVKRDLNYQNLFAEIFYFQNYHSGLWSHTWSLAVEEHFYIFLPIIFCFLQAFSVRHNSKMTFIYLLFLVVIVNLLKYNQNLNLASDNRITFYSHLRIDALLFGVLLSYCYKYFTKWFQWWTKYISLPIIVLALPLIYKIGVAGVFSPIQFEYGYTILYIYFGNLLLWTISTETVFENKVFFLPVKLGFYSYSIYLWHMPCKFWVVGRISQYIEFNYFVKLLLYIVSSLVVGVGFAKLIEMPFLKIRDRFFPSKIKWFLN